ncbi:MAG: hypothetical protein J5608_03040 [Alphaproteobacteria bacterium]|nr:hypothetical protein [Alphaproteobacteria bacterium]
MHFFKNSVSFIAVMCVFGATYAAVAPGRVGVLGAASTSSRRLPALSNIMKAAGITTSGTALTATSVSKGTALVSDADCVEDYRDCMKGDDACGSNFEECTTNVLFHGHMSECVSTLYQCSSSAIQSLFGTSDLNALSKVDSYVADTNNTEVARYTYPTDGSIMGMDIIGAATRNKLSAADCVKKYKNCLNKDTVCGEDFELCTSDSEFKKQAALCDNVLSRCQKEGFQQLFGNNQTTKPVGRNLKKPAEGSVKDWIEDGELLAASNAVNTCYKVIDNCFLSACAKNPYSCVEGVNVKTIQAADELIGVDASGTRKITNNSTATGKTVASDVRKYFRASCTDTIGDNQYCFMTFNEGRKPSKADLKDEELRDDIFGQAYDTRKNITNTKVQELLKKFDTNAKNKCLDVFKTCAVRSCGGGSGAVCYTRVFGDDTANKVVKSINYGTTYVDIKAGCEAIVNTDANCKYMAATMRDENNEYSYTFSDDGETGAFATLFPQSDGTTNTSDIVVATLNAELAASYNDVEIANMKKACKNVVTGCVKSMCGSEYSNCYRNRSDIKVGTYTTENATFNKSMNRVGGVLDYTIVQGLCALTVKNNSACEESFAIAKAGLKDNGIADLTKGWNYGIEDGQNSTLGGAWRNSARSVGVSAEKIQNYDANGKMLCKCTEPKGNASKTKRGLTLANQSSKSVDICLEDGGYSNCTEHDMVTEDIYLETQAVNDVFQEVLADIESEAQAIYNAKLTKEQNVCLASNPNSNPDSTFVWAKLKAKLPTDYAQKGFGNTTIASNELYDSFCRVKVTIKSSDPTVNTLINGGSVEIHEVKTGMFGIDGLMPDKKLTGEKALKGNNESTAYFSAGDAFTCGSWISQDTLDKITQKVAADARAEAGEGSQKEKNTKLWATLGTGLAGGIGSYFGMDAIQRNGSSLGGLLKTDTTSSSTKNAEKCVKAVQTARTRLMAAQNAPANSAALTSFQTAANNALTEAALAGVDTADINFYGNAYNANMVQNTIQDNTLYVNAWNACLGRLSPQSPQRGYVQDIVNYLTGVSGTRYYAVESYNELVATTLDNTALCNYGSDGLLLPSNTASTTTNQPVYDTSDWNTYTYNLNTLEQRCQMRRTEDEDDRKARLKANMITGAVTSVATAAIAGGIVASVQNAKYEEAANDAVKEWLDNVGSKIQCWIGNNEVATYGQTVGIEITEE